MHFKDDPPCYISNQQVHDLLVDKICDMSHMMSTALVRSSEHGGFLLEGRLSAKTRVRGISCPLSMTVVEITDKGKTIAFDKHKFLIIDDEALDAMETASLVLCAFKASVGQVDSFAVEDDMSSHYLAQALLEEDLVEEVLVPSDEMIEYLDDDRAKIGTRGTGQFFRKMTAPPGQSEFVASEQVSIPTEDLAGIFSCCVAAEKAKHEGWTTISEVLRNGLDSEGAVFFLCAKPMVCKTVAVKMLLDALGGKNAL